MEDVKNLDKPCRGKQRLGKGGGCLYLATCSSASQPTSTGVMYNIISTWLRCTSGKKWKCLPTCNNMFTVFVGSQRSPIAMALAFSIFLRLLFLICYIKRWYSFLIPTGLFSVFLVDHHNSYYSLCCTANDKILQRKLKVRTKAKT